jgi:hypothetical protein
VIVFGDAEVVVVVVEVGLPIVESTSWDDKLRVPALGRVWQYVIFFFAKYVC